MLIARLFVDGNTDDAEPAAATGRMVGRIARESRWRWRRWRNRHVVVIVVAHVQMLQLGK